MENIKRFIVNDLIFEGVDIVVALLIWLMSWLLTCESIMLPQQSKTDT